MSGHLDGPPPGPPDPPYIPGDLGAPSAEEFARRRASSEPRPEVRDCPLMHGAAPCPMCAYCPHGLTAGRGADERCLECGAAVTEPRPENPYPMFDENRPTTQRKCWDAGFASRQPEIDRLEAGRDEATRQREQAATSRNVIAEQRDKAIDRLVRLEREGEHLARPAAEKLVSLTREGEEWAAEQRQTIHDLGRVKAAEGRRLSRVDTTPQEERMSDLREDQGYPDGTFVSPIAGDPPIKPFPTEHIEYRVVGPRWQGSVYQHRNYAEDERRCMIDPARYRIEQRTVTTGDWTPSEKPETP